LGIDLTKERVAEIVNMLQRMDSALNRLKFLGGAGSTDVIARGDAWFGAAGARGIDISKLDTLFYGVRRIDTMLVMQQANDAYVLGLLDAVPVLCRTALEEELTMRYLEANGLIATTAAGTLFKTLTNGRTATLENLIQWATTTSPPILTSTSLPLARDVQEVGNDYAHAYAMRRVTKSISGTGNLFTNTRAIEIYEKTLKVFDQMP
jgi:hypothetical protein